MKKETWLVLFAKRERSFDIKKDTRFLGNAVSTTRLVFSSLHPSTPRSPLTSRRRCLCRDRRPELVCGLCAHLKSYHGVVGHWTHLVQNHRDRSAEDQVCQVRRVARVWKGHLVEIDRAGGGCDVATWAKLEQVGNNKVTWRWWSKGAFGSRAQK
ncbi:uncharacterized protein PG986_013260 [Apiospora aurea]|uniref:Uncharacterized protein n=1 Tax=Apiospora aurea TaxID=335848 RepID=A0ABR1PV28_9PEZI